MLTSEQELKRDVLRYAEYYDQQIIFDELYAKSKAGMEFNKLINLITHPENIKLAYRNIKNNTGSYTPGTDGKTLKDLAGLSEEKFIKLVQNQFVYYHPKAVRRVEIPKQDGSKRPLGIPNILDRVVQQCIKQILEPICEAKFYRNSHGFRPNHSAENALADCMHYATQSKLHYVVDIDIKSFFDNVDHSKLIKQLWTMGIRDKKLICIIKEILKAPIKYPDGTIIYPDKGTPQGGILSPLLANIVLNELDWWVASQWEEMPSHIDYKVQHNQKGYEIKSSKYRALRSSNLKEMHIVRYADDFKIFCRNYRDAVNTFYAIKLWLSDRLHLEINEEKSKIVNLERQYSEFLGFKFKLWKKANKYVIESHMSDKAIKHVTKELKRKIVEIQHSSNNLEQYKRLNEYNSLVLGYHQYYCKATHVSIDFQKIGWNIKKTINNRLTGIKKKGTTVNKVVLKRYGNSAELRYLNGTVIFPVCHVQHSSPMSKDCRVNAYTPEGRQLIHKNLSINISIMKVLMENPVINASIEFNDNRVSLYCAQHGKCAVTGKSMEYGEIQCHHKIPRNMGGTDKYQNLILIIEPVHRLVHAVSYEIIKKYLSELHLTKQQLNKINKLRELANLPIINISEEFNLC